ncbi:recombination regulator RecX [Bacillus tianshenii]|nr:recombination regulator RecX [Bacillus tianshenii]
MKITKITAQKKNENRLNLFIDDGSGERYGFSLDMDVFAKYQLKKGMEIDEVVIQELLHEDQIKKAFSLALNYLSYRMRSTKEIKEYLAGKEIDEGVIESVIERLNTYKYINDLEFAKAFVRTKKRATVKGPMLLQRELQEKGITGRNADAGLAEYSFGEQVDVATQFAKKKQKQYKKESAVQAEQKIKQALMQKGFSFDVINEAVSELQLNGESAEWEALRHQAEKAERKYRKYEGREFDLKVKQYLYRRGFSMEQINKWLNHRFE